MDDKFKLKQNNRQLVKYIKLIIIVLLVIMGVLICAQCWTRSTSGGGILRMSCVCVCCVMLVALEAVDSFLIKKFAAKMVFYGVDSVLLLIICLLTGNAYLAILYCIVLTQFYISVDDMKSNAILCGVSGGGFIVSFVCGWVAVNNGASLYESIVAILGDCVFGVFILGMHFAVINFILKFYSTNAQLRYALNEAAESEARLKEVYEQLSNTAVYEERNRIAKDIHDNAGHSMTAVIMQTEAAKLLVDTNPEEAKNKIISANIQAKNALEQMRESVHLLAGRKQTCTLREEIEEILAQTIDGTELKIRSDLEDVSVGSEESRFLCNSLKESIANGIRHGGATAFYIELKNVFSSVSLLISDNGCGTQGELKEGFGLRSMREKAASFGGRCEFSGEAGEGFEVEITLPVQK